MNPLEHETLLRLTFFFGVFAVMAWWEFQAPRRHRNFARLQRWPSNIALVMLNTVLLRVLVPVSAIEVARATEAGEWGLLNWLGLHVFTKTVIAVILLDMTIYWQHVLFHRVPVLWRLHRMHHADLDLDCTSGTRFHTIEMFLSMGIKVAAIVLLGAPALAVLAFEIILNALAMFNHSNVAIPEAVDSKLRRWLVTPDMHRVHHSIVATETHSNFGFNLSCWDRLFKTYRAQPEAGHDGMTIGLPQFRTPADLRLDRLLMLPWQDHR